MILPILGKIYWLRLMWSKSLALIDSMHTSTEEIAAKSRAKLAMNAYAPFKLEGRYLGRCSPLSLLSCFAITLGMTLADGFRFYRRR